MINKATNRKPQTTLPRIVIFGAYAVTHTLLQSLIAKHGREVTFGQIALPRAYPRRLEAENG